MEGQKSDAKALVHDENVLTDPKMELQSKSSPMPSGVSYISSIDLQYVIDLVNGETIRISENEVIKRSGASRMEELTVGMVVDVIEKKVLEHLKLLQERDLPYWVSKD